MASCRGTGTRGSIFCTESGNYFDFAPCPPNKRPIKPSQVKPSKAIQNERNRKKYNQKNIQFSLHFIHIDHNLCIYTTHTIFFSSNQSQIAVRLIYILYMSAKSWHSNWIYPNTMAIQYDWIILNNFVFNICGGS